MKNFILFIVLFITVINSYAECKIINSSFMDYNNAIRLNFGVFVINSRNDKKGISAPLLSIDNIEHETVLWQCTNNERGRIKLLAAFPIGLGFHGEKTKDKNYYTTRIKNTAISLTVGNKVLNNNWQEVPFQGDFDPGSEPNTFVIKMKDLPQIKADLKPLSYTPIKKTSDPCESTIKTDDDNDPTLRCARNHAYIQLAGFSNSSAIADNEGSTADRNNSKAIQNGNGVGITMFRGIYIYSDEVCYITEITPNLIQFAPISVQELNEGNTRTGSFNINFKCTNSRKGKNNSNLFLQITPAKLTETISYEPNLLTGQDIVSHLISDNYTNSTTAQGVGVRLLSNSQSIKFIKCEHYFISNKICLATGAKVNINNLTEGSKINVTAILEKLPNAKHPVRAGNFNASATVIMRLK